MLAMLLRALQRWRTADGGELQASPTAANGLCDAVAAALAALVEASVPATGRAAMLPVFTSGACLL